MAPYIEGNRRRPRVLVIGPRLAALEPVMQSHGFSVEFTSSWSSLSAEVPADVQAVLLTNALRLREMLQSVYRSTWDSGAFLGVLLTDERDSNERPRISAVVKSVVTGDEDRRVQEGALKILPSWDAVAIGSACVQHHAGRPLSRTLDLDRGNPVVPLDAMEEALLRRAFEGYKRISIRELTGGLTESRLLGVDATHQDTGLTCAPLVAKIGFHGKIRHELETTRDFVADFVPFPNRPAVLHDRCVIGAQRRLLVSRLVDQALRLDDAIGRTEFDDAELIVRLIFDGALRVWRTQAAAAIVDLTNLHRRRLARAEPTLQRTAAKAARLDANVGSLEQMWQLTESWRALRISQCFVHGDLHVRNVFLRQFPRDSRMLDVVLIDYASSGRVRPASRDIAALEVSVALDDLLHCAPLSSSQLEDIYLYANLYDSLDTLDDSLPQAGVIKALRSYARDNRLSLDEYEVSILWRLLHSAFMIPSRGVDAYRLAWYTALRLDARLGPYRT